MKETGRYCKEEPGYLRRFLGRFLAQNSFDCTFLASLSFIRFFSVIQSEFILFSLAILKMLFLEYLQFG